MSSLEELQMCKYVAHWVKGALFFLNPSTKEVILVYFSYIVLCFCIITNFSQLDYNSGLPDTSHIIDGH